MVLDIDPRNGGDESWAMLLQEAGQPEPETVSVVTGGDGRHLYFRKPEGCESFASSSGLLGNGIDVKSDGGFVVAPPSGHASGRTYEWDGAYTLKEVPIAKLPNWLHQLLTNSSANQCAESGAGTGAPEGQRNNTLFKKASAWRGHDVPKSEAQNLARAFAANCEVSFDVEEALRVVDHVYGSFVPNTGLKPRAFDMKLVPAAQIPIGRTDWVIEDVLPGGELSVMYANKGVGKSFTAVDMSCHIVNGTDWMGHSVTAGEVVYVACEGRGGYRDRVAAWEQFNGTSATGLQFLVSNGVNLRESTWSEDFVSHISATGTKPVLVVIDTLSSAFGAGEENASDAMMAAVAGCRTIIEGTGAAVLLLHHSGKSGAAGPRGHSSLAGSANAVLRLVENGPDAIALQCEHQRDADAFAAVSMSLTSFGGSRVITSGPGGAASVGNKVTKFAAATHAIQQALANAPAGMQNGELLTASGATLATFNRALNELKSSGGIRLEGKVYFLTLDGPVAA